MPKITTEIPEVEESIKRPIIFDVVKKMLSETGIDPSVPVFFNGDTAVGIPQVGSTMDDSTDPYNNEVRLPAKDKIIISVTEEYPEETGIAIEINRPDVPIFFNDEDLGVYMKPVYQTTLFTISVRYRAQSKTMADKWRNNLFRSIRKMRMGYQHLIQYHYPIPLSFIYLISTIWNLREKNLPLNETLGNYVKRCMDPSYTVITNQAGKSPTIVMRESQICVIGNYELQDAVKFDRDDATSLYETGFDYTFTADICHQCWMQYPLLVHNQLIPSTFYYNPWPIDWMNYIQKTSMFKDAFDKISDPVQTQAGGIQGISIPYFDDWLPVLRPPCTIDIARIMLQVDPTNLRNVLNLSNLGNFSFDSLTLNYLYQAYNGVTVNGNAALLVTLYLGYHPLSSSTINMDSQLNITTNFDLDQTQIYHLIISINTDILGLNPAAKLVLIENGQFTNNILLALRPQLATNIDKQYSGFNNFDITPTTSTTGPIYQKLVNIPGSLGTNTINNVVSSVLPIINARGWISLSSLNIAAKQVDAYYSNVSPLIFSRAHNFNVASIFLVTGV